MYYFCGAVLLLALPSNNSSNNYTVFFYGNKENQGADKTSAEKDCRW